MAEVQDNPKLQQFHDALVKSNYNVPDYNTFSQTLKDPAKSKEFYDALQKDKYELPDYDTFASDLGLKKKDASDYGLPSSEVFSQMFGNISKDAVKESTKEPEKPLQGPQSLSSFKTPELNKSEIKGPQLTSDLRSSIADDLSGRRMSPADYKKSIEDKIAELDKKIANMPESKTDMTITTGNIPFAGPDAGNIPVSDAKAGLLKMRDDLKMAISNPSKLDYILGKAYNQSIIGLSDAILNGERRAPEDWLKKYDASTLEDVTATTLGFLLDSPMFGLGGKIGSMIGEAAAKPIVNRAIKKGVEKLIDVGIEEQTAKKLALKGTERLTQGIIGGTSSGTALGSYGFLTSALNDWAVPGAHFDDIKYGQAFKRGAKDFVLGTGIGMLGIASSAVAEKARAISQGAARAGAQVGIAAGGLTAESALFTYGGALLDGKNPKDVTAKDFLQTAAMLLMLKGSQMVQAPKEALANIRKSTTFNSGKPGEDDFEVHIEPWEANSLGYANYKELMDASAHSDRFLAKTLNDENVPAFLKMRLLWGARGLAMDDVNLYPERVVSNKGNVEYYNKDGVLVEREKYTSDEEADQIAIRRGLQLEDNRKQMKAAGLSTDKVRVITELNDKGIDPKKVIESLDKPVADRTPEDSKVVSEFNKAVDKSQLSSKDQKRNEEMLAKKAGEPVESAATLGAKQEVTDAEKNMKFIKNRIETSENLFKLPISSEGNEVGNAIIDNTKDGWRLKWITVEGSHDTKSSRKGIGRVAMKLMNEQAAMEGKVLMSDFPGSQSDAMKSAWDKLVASGDAEKLPDGSWAFKKAKEKPVEPAIPKKKKLVKFKPESRTYKAINKPPNDFTEAALQFFIGGGRIKTQDLMDHTGYKRGDTDFNKLFGLHSKEGTPLDVFHEALTNSFGIEEKGAMDMVNEVIDLIKKYPSRGQMLTELERRQKGEEQEAPTEEEIKAQEDQIRKEKGDALANSYDIEADLKNGLITKAEYDEIRDYENQQAEQSRIAEESFYADQVSDSKSSKGKSITPKQQDQIDAINEDYDDQIADKQKELDKIPDQIEKAVRKLNERNGLFGDTTPVDEDELIKREDQGFKADLDAVRKPFKERQAQLTKEIDALNKERKSKIGEITNQAALDFEEKSQAKPEEVKPEYWTKENAPKGVKAQFNDVELKDGAEEALKKLPKKLIMTLDDGTKVYAVNGLYIRDNVHQDFTQGGNEGSYPSYIPKGEMWIDEVLGEKDREATILHENVERKDMLNNGTSYKDAHEKANKAEENFRETGEKPEIKPVDEKPNEPSTPTGKGKEDNIPAGTGADKEPVTSESKKESDTGKAWSGVVDLTDGTINQTYTRKQAEDADWHHSFLVGADYDRAIARGEKAYFFLDKSGEPTNMDNTLSPKIKRAIKEQLKKPVTPKGEEKPIEPKFEPTPYGKAVQEIRGAQEAELQKLLDNAPLIQKNLKVTSVKELIDLFRHGSEWGKTGPYKNKKIKATGLQELDMWLKDKNTSPESRAVFKELKNYFQNENKGWGLNIKDFETKLIAEKPKGIEYKGKTYKSIGDVQDAYEAGDLTKKEEQELREKIYDVPGSAEMSKEKPGPIEETEYGQNKSKREAKLIEDLKKVPTAKTSIGARLSHIKDIFDNLNTSIPAAEKKTWDRLGMKLHNLKENVKAVWKAYSEMPSWTDYKQALGDWSMAKQINDKELMDFTKLVEKKIPSRARREAIVNYIEADGNTSLLKEREKTSRLSHRQGYKDAQKLTPDEKNIANSVKEYFDDMLKMGYEAGILKSQIDNYVTHFGVRPDDPAVTKIIGGFDNGKLNTTFKYAKGRVFDTFHDLENAGFRAGKDFKDIIPAYSKAFHRTIFSRAFIKNLTEGKAEDGRPLVAQAGMGSLTGDENISQAALVNPYSKPEEVSDYRYVNHPAFRDWYWATKTPDGTNVFAKGELVVHPDYAKKLSNILGSSDLMKSIPLRNISKGVNVTKQTIFMLSPFFHYIQEGYHALGHTVNPLWGLSKFNPEDVSHQKLLQAGLKLYDFQAKYNFAEGLAALNVASKIPIIKSTILPLQEYLFGEYIPRLKLTTAEHMIHRNLKRYQGKYSEDQIFALSASQANAAYGNLNYELIGRNPTVQHLFRTMALAPDFLEARTRFVGQALTPKGAEQRRALMILGGTMFVASRILNKLFDDDYHWDKPFSFIYKKNEYTLRSVPEDVWELINDPNRFTYNRMSPLFRSVVVEGLTKRDFRGIPETTEDWLKSIVTSPMPTQITRMLPEGWGKSESDNKLWDDFVNTIGLRERHYFTPIEKEIRNTYYERDPRGRFSENQKNKNKIRQEINKIATENGNEPLSEDNVKKMSDLISENVKNGKLTIYQGQDLLDNIGGEKKDINLTMYNRLPEDDKERIYNKMSDKEKEAYPVPKGMYGPYNLLKDKNKDVYDRLIEYGGVKTIHQEAKLSVFNKNVKLDKKASEEFDDDLIQKYGEQVQALIGTDKKRFDELKKTEMPITKDNPDGNMLKEYLNIAWERAHLQAERTAKMKYINKK